MKHRTQLQVTAAATALLIALAACGDSGDSDNDMTIGVPMATTGDLGALGASAVKAVNLAAEELTRAAEDAGSDFRFNAEAADTQSTPEAAQSATRQLVDGGASCLVGPSSTPEARAMLSGVTRAREIAMLPSASSVALSDIEDDNTIFRTIPPDNLQARALVSSVEQVLGGASGRRVSIGFQNTPYGEGLSNAFAEGWRANGGEVLTQAGYDPNQPSYDSEAGRLVANNPDAIIVADFPDTFGKVAAALLRTGEFDPNRLFVADALAVSPVPDSIPAQALNGAYGTRAGVPPNTQQGNAFDELYRNADGPGRFALDANNFDAAILCGLATIAADSTDPGDIKDEIAEVANPGGERYTYLQLSDAISALQDGQDIDYEGVSGVIDFDDNGDTVSGTYDLFRWANNEIVVQNQIDATQD